jgi:NADPH:quinone reductase
MIGTSAHRDGPLREPVPRSALHLPKGKEPVGHSNNSQESAMPFIGRQLTSTVQEDGVLRLALDTVTVGDPGVDEIIVRIEAAPINPSDLGLLLGPAEIKTMKALGVPERPELSFEIPSERLGGIAARIGQRLGVGNEGAGTVVAAGESAKGLIGKRVGLFGGEMYADHRKLPASEAVVLPPAATAAQGAAIFVNPLTALGFVETARRENHGAIVHTAAASSLGQMLQRICLKDGVPLVNIVRSQEQAKILREIGASFVLDSSKPDFRLKLLAAIEKTGATIAFDAIGGGRLGSDIMAAMEQAATRRMTTYSRYGSDVFKQLYLYGRLDPALTVLNRPAFGSQWSVSGWLLMPMLNRFGVETVSRMKARVVDELTTTFAIHYSRTIGLAEALTPDVLLAYERKSTGQKFLIDPRLD